MARDAWTPAPVARTWRMTGPGLGEPGVAEELCEAAMARLADIAHALGAIVLVNRPLHRMRVVSIVDSRRDEVSAEDILDRVREVLPPSDAYELGGPWSYDVAFSSFTEFPGRAQVSAIDQPLARVTVGVGGTLAYPAVVDVLRDHTANGLQFPGCVGAMLLCNTLDARVIGASFWADQRSVDRTAEVSAEAFRTISTSTGASIQGSSVDEVLYIRPMPRPFP